MTLWTSLIVVFFVDLIHYTDLCKEIFAAEDTARAAYFRGHLSLLLFTNDSSFLFLSSHLTFNQPTFQRSCPAMSFTQIWIIKWEIVLSDMFNRERFISACVFVYSDKCLRLAVFEYLGILTLKAPRETASENVVCLCRLLNILADFPNLVLHSGKQCGPRSDCS